jgi:hypothetical protein
MDKPLPRLHLRVAQDNPIFTVPAGKRNQKADEWMRIGCTTERLERVIDKLEDLLGQISNGEIAYKKEQNPEQVNQKDLKKSLNLIHAILAEAEQE